MLLNSQNIILNKMVFLEQWLPDIVSVSCSVDFLAAPKGLVQYKLGIQLYACHLLQQEGSM